MNDEVIWNFLIKEIKNEYGVAGLMGNLQAESALSPTNLQDSYNKAWNLTDQRFTEMCDKEEFDFCCTDKGNWGYGLAQWTSVGRRINLWIMKCQKQVSIGDINLQLEFLIKELKTSYKSVYNVLISAKSIREASDVVLTKFEIPADQSENVKQYRANLGQRFYDKFSGTQTGGLQKHQTIKYKPGTYKVTTEKGLNVREKATTDSNVVTQMPYETMFYVSKTDNEWGFVPVVNGWTCLEYATRQ